jgi:hypothetical protein
MNRKQCGRAIGLLFLGFLLSGCGRGDGPGAKLAPVRGRVVFKNQAVSAAEIYFHPDTKKGNNGPMASAILQEDGSFTMATSPKAEGVAPGWYKVTLTLGRRPEPELAKFRRVETTTLSINVPEEGKEDVLFKLD